MTNSFEQYLFGPIKNVNYCYLFYVISVVAFIYVFLYIISGIIMMINKKMDAKYSFLFLYMVGLSFFVYFQNRLLYTMCSHSI